MPSANNQTSKELFSYVKLEAPRVIDLQTRIKQITPLRQLTKKTTDEKIKWANDFLSSSNAVRDIPDLRFDYFSLLTIKTLDPYYLPSAEQIADPEQFKKVDILNHPKYKVDYTNCISSIMAFKILNDQENIQRTSQLLHFLEIFPRLNRIPKGIRYAPAIMNKLNIKSKTPKVVAGYKPATKPNKEAETKQELHQLAENIVTLWNARNKMLKVKKKEFDKAYQEIMNSPHSIVIQQPVQKSNKKKKVQNNTNSTSNTQKAFHAKKAELETLKTTYKTARNSGDLQSMIAWDDKVVDKELGKLPGKPGSKTSDFIKDIKDKLNKYDIQTDKFCEAYETIVKKADTIITPIVTPQSDISSFKENPILQDFNDTVRLLGKAQLVKVEETFMGYSVGEISYVENIFAGELRKREVKSTKYFEQVTETLKEETTDTTEETSTSSKQELSSQIDTELSSRFNSDINSSVNGSGGGTIGVVDFEAGGSAGANVDIGVESSTKTSNSSKFSQEIINKAIEKTKKMSIEKRLTKSYSLYETFNSYTIDNSGEESKNGIYCFLDKHVCIKETVYGLRLFLMANLAMPGKNLLGEKTHKLQLALNEAGQKPIFDISPNDIHPQNYLELAGRFKASNVQPPPPPIINLGKTYKTDGSNANVEQQEMKFKQVANILVPFFEQYKRFLITDNIKIPEGYTVREVTVTVNHGRNGISVPAHVPLTVAGAAAFAIPATLSMGAYGALLLPLAIWEIGYLASPLLHYNSDSSNVTVCVGNEYQDSAYYFFEPPMLMNKIFSILGDIASITPEMFEGIKKKADKLYAALKTNALEIPGSIGNAISGSVDSLISLLKSVFDAVAAAVNPNDLKSPQKKVQDIIDAKNKLMSSINLEDLVTKLGNLFEPLKQFFDEVFQLVGNGMMSSITHFFEILNAAFEASQILSFTPGNLKGELPLSINTIAIKPGVTLNLTACLQRTDEALDKWRLETFQNLYQAHLQLLAEYESKMFISGNPEKMFKSPGTLRQEEHLAVKERVMYALNNRFEENDNRYTLERMNLFEHAIDWKNMSYRLYNYGPNPQEILLDKQGIFSGIDARRKAFLTAVWAQVFIPLQSVDHLEQQMRNYLENREFNVDSLPDDLGTDSDELTALYQDLVLERELLDEKPTVLECTHAVIPTDLMVLRTDTLEQELTIFENNCIC